jgi:hypothetical protein
MGGAPWLKVARAMVVSREDWKKFTGIKLMLLVFAMQEKQAG